MKKGLLLLLCFSLELSAEVLSQWRGPQRDGNYPEKNLLTSWPAGGPQKLWSATDLGIGYSSPAVTAQAVYITSLIGDEGVLFAFDHHGKLLWRTGYGKEWNKGHEGARSTPTVVDDRIYLISGMGTAVCLTTTGKVVWSVDLLKTFGGRLPEWGMAESPLIDGDRMVCTPGGISVLMAALDRHTGKTIWQCKGNGEISAYCSPLMISHGGRRLIVTMTQKSVIGVDADSGEMLWRQPHITSWDVNPNTPLYRDGRIYALSGYGTGGQMLELSPDGRTIKQLFTAKAPDSQIAGAVWIDDFIYSSGHNNRGWACLDAKTGKLMWTSREYGGKGPLIAADGLLYLYSERGDLVLVKPNPQKFEPISAFSITEGSGPHWAHPVIRAGRLYIRHGNVLLVYKIFN